MPINTGYIEATKLDGALRIRVYYDPAAPVTGPQPLIDGPRGFCLDVTNTTGRNQRLDVTLPNGSSATLNFGQGDPVNSGPASGRSRTAAQLATLGLVNRSDVSGIALGD